VSPNKRYPSDEESVRLPVCSLLLATGLSSLSLSDTSDLLDSALDFLSLLSSNLASDDVAVLYNNRELGTQRFIIDDFLSKPK
jgi:hypothetical protein